MKRSFFSPSSSRLARAIFLALCVSGQAWAQDVAPEPPTPPPVTQTSDEAQDPATDADLSPTGEPVSTPTPPNPPEAEVSVALDEEVPWIWVDLCIKETGRCFTGVAARPPGEGRAHWEADLSLENLEEVDLDASMLKMHEEDGANWVILETIEFDEGNLALSWSLPLEVLQSQTFLDNNADVLKGVSEGEHPFSAAIGYTVAYGDAVSVVGDLAIGKKHTALLTTFSWTQEGDGIIRGLARVEHDQPSKNLRWSAGEILAFSPDPLGGAALIRGVGVGRTFETSPTMITTARPSMSGVVDRSGTLEVYSNGMLISAREVRPGPYTLEQLGVMAGRQNISIVLKDEAGNRTTLMQTSYYGTSSLLAKGLTDFALRAGTIQPGALIGSEQIQPEERLVQAYWRRGFSERLTLGVRADVGQTVQSYGVTGAVATPFGEVSGSVANSSAGGSAYFGTYSFSSRKFSFGLSHLEKDAQYRVPGEFIPGPVSEVPVDDPVIEDPIFGLPVFDERVLTSSSGSLSLSVIPRMSLSFSHSRDTYETGVTSVRNGVQVGGEFFGRAQWNVTYQDQKRSDIPESMSSLSLTVSIPMGRRQNTTFFAAQGDEGTGYGLNWNRGRLGEYGASYGLNIQQSATGLRGGVARADYQGQRGLYAVQVDRLGDEQSVQGSVSGAVVVAARNVFLAPPLGSSYAILKATDAPGVPVVRENVPAGNTNSRGYALVRNLSPYYPSQIGFDPEELPIDIDPGEVIARRIIPTPHTATMVEFNASPVFAAQAQLMWPGDEPVHYGSIMFGEPLNETVQLGTDGMLWIERVEPGVYVGDVVTEAGTGRCTLDVKAQTESVQDLGQIVCERLTQTKQPQAAEAPIEPEAPAIETLPPAEDAADTTLDTAPPGETP